MSLQSRLGRRLAALTKGNAAPLANLARLEQAAADTPAGRLTLADAWSDQAEKEPAGPYRAAEYRRAGHWYDLCDFDLSGADRAEAEKRLERIGQMGE